MGCSHCLGDCAPDNRHMSLETLHASLQFVADTQPLAVIVTGGEPLEHPQAERFILEVVGLVGPDRTILCTNGEHLDKDMAAGLGCNIQVVNDPLYYPRTVTPVSASNVQHFSSIPAPIYPVGRAAKNGIPGARLSPSCFNLRSIVRHSKFDLVSAMKMLELRGKYCTPVIDWDGGIVLGETSQCPAVGSVHDSLGDLTASISSCQCRACGLDTNLAPEYRKAVWG